MTTSRRSFLGFLTGAAAFAGLVRDRTPEPEKGAQERPKPYWKGDTLYLHFSTEPAKSPVKITMTYTE